MIPLPTVSKLAPFPLLFLALLIAVSGCSDKAAPSTAQTPTDGPPQMAPQQTAPPQTGPPPATAVVPDTTSINGKSVHLKSTPSGLKYYDLKVGTGPNPKIGQTVSVQYTGTLLDGTKFDSSYDHGGAPIDFPIGVRQVIKGWDEGVPTMKVGGKRRLVIPADLAYGDAPPSPQIPPGATLVFDIELVGIK